MKKMKQSTKLIILSASLAVLIIAAVLVYNFLIKNYTPNENGQSDSSQSDTSQKESVSAPDFTVYGSDGSSFRLSDFNGKPKVVNFWATWCGPCKSELPAFDNMYRKYKDKVDFLMVNLTDGYQQTVSGVQKFVDQNGYTFPVYFDTSGSAAYTYNVYSIPQTVFINEEGNIYGIYPGAMDEQRLEGYINDILK